MNNVNTTNKRKQTDIAEEATKDVLDETCENSTPFKQIILPKKHQIHYKKNTLSQNHRQRYMKFVKRIWVRKIKL